MAAVQVDAGWLARKQYGGPSEDDLKKLAISDPIVHRNLTFSTNNNSAPVTGKSKDYLSGAKYNSEFGLYCEMDKTTLQPTFRMEVNAVDVLGRLSVLDSLQFGAQERENHRINSMLSMISASTL